MTDCAVPRITEILPTVAVALGTPLAEGSGWTLPSADAYVVALVDGMGADLLAEHADLVPFLASIENAMVGRSEIPSTTATSLTSLGTALPPSMHGVPGYTSRIPGTDRLLNALTWDASVDPLDWQPLPTAYERLASAGIEVNVVGAREYESSGLTGVSQRGARYRGADRFGERVASAVAASSTTPSLTYVYDGDLDWIGHRHGVDSVDWRAQLRAIDAGLAQLRDALHDGVRLLITADHGMVDVPAVRRFDVDAVKGLRQDIELIGGEARFRHLYCAQGTAPAVAARWQDALGERAIVRTLEDAQATGWFGPIDERVRRRFGDVVVASLGDFAVMSRADHPMEYRLVGMHGSVTERERRIPLLCC